MLSKHFENVRQKSDNYKSIYAVVFSVAFTSIIAGLWVFSFFIPSVSGSSASVLSAVDGSSDITPTKIVKQEAGGAFDSFYNTIKGLSMDNFMGGKYKVKYENGTLGLNQNNSANVSNSVSDSESNSDATFSTTTKDGITVEFQKNSSLTDKPITPDESSDQNTDSNNVSGN